MPAHSRSKNGVAELVIGPATSGRTRWLAYVAGIHVLRATITQDVDGRNKSGHDEMKQKTPTATNEKARVHPASPHHRGRPATEPLLTSLFSR
jgi:hypothetical protein